MVAAYVALHLGIEIREATRLLIAWNIGAWAFLVMILHMVIDPRREASVQSKPEDENQWVLVVLELSRPSPPSPRSSGGWSSQELRRLAEAGHLALVGSTVLSAWGFLQVMFALHYAGVYFVRQRGKYQGGLDSPAAQTRDGWSSSIRPSSSAAPSPAPT